MSGEDKPEIRQDLPEQFEDWSFEEWCGLHERDPEAFEACRLRMLNNLIETAPEESRPRLRGLMFRMEGESRRSKSQLGYVLRLSSMMMEMLDEMRAHLSSLVASDAARVENPAQPAEVIRFEPRARNEETD